MPLMVVLGMASSSSSSMTIITLNEELSDVKSMKFTADFSLGDLVIERGHEDMAVTGYLKYNENHIDGSLDYKEYGSTGILKLNTDVEVDFNWDFEKNKRNTMYNESEIYLTTRIPISMNLDMSMGNSDLKLERLKISDFSLDVGMGEVTIDFGERMNPVNCRKVDIDAGMGSATVKNLLNANTDQMEFGCGLGSMNLEFSGLLEYDVDVDISIGMGSVKIQIPAGYNVIFEYDGSFLSNIDMDGFSQKGDEYRSRDFNPNAPVIRISGSIGAGNLEISWINR